MQTGFRVSTASYFLDFGQCANLDQPLFRPILHTVTWLVNYWLQFCAEF